MNSQALPFYGYCHVCGKAREGANLTMDGLEPRCISCWESPTAEIDHTHRDPKVVVSEQIGDAKHAMDRELSEYVHMPFPSVDAMVGAIPPGDVGFIVAFSGQGKTTFVTSAIQGLLDAGKGVYCLPLESEAMTFRTHLACKALGYHAGMVLTGEYKRTQPDAWPIIRAAIIAEMEKQKHGDMAQQLYVSPTRRMDGPALRKAAKHAASLGAHVLVVDHIDHIQGEGKNLHAESTRVVDTTLDVTQEYGLVTWATSQLNNEGSKSDPLGMYQCPQPHHIYMGGKKRQNAAWMIGLSRPLKFGEIDRDTLAAVRSRRLEAWRVLEPNCMCINDMKSRHFGEREGHRTYLRVQDGCVVEDPSLNALANHGIRSGGML